MEVRGEVEEAIRCSFWLGRMFFEELNYHNLNFSGGTLQPEDILYEMLNEFIQEFRDEIGGDWISIFQNYNVMGYGDLVYEWGRKRLWEKYQIEIE